MEKDDAADVTLAATAGPIEELLRDIGIYSLVAFGASLQGTSDLSESCNGPLCHVLDESVVVFGRFVITHWPTMHDITRKRICALLEKKMKNLECFRL